MAARMIYAAATVAENTAKVVQMGKQIAEMLNSMLILSTKTEK